MGKRARRRAKQQILDAISVHGYFSYFIAPAPLPKYTYTIGLSSSPYGAELVCAGEARLTKDEQVQVVRERADRLVAPRPSSSSGDGVPMIPVREVAVDPSWVRLLFLGAVDEDILPAAPPFVQLIPIDRPHSIDAPDLSRPFDPDREGPWRWAVEDWPYAPAERTMVMVNGPVLDGERVNRVGRYEPDDWELLAESPEPLRSDDGFVVPLGTVVGHDPSVAPALTIGVDECVWSDFPGDPWDG